MSAGGRDSGEYPGSLSKLTVELDGCERGGVEGARDGAREGASGDEGAGGEHRGLALERECVSRRDRDVDGPNVSRLGRVRLAGAEGGGGWRGRGGGG